MRVFLLTLAILFSASTALAHTLESDGSIGAIMHVDPGDSPVEDAMATFDFEVKDTTGRFDAKRCECMLQISLGGSQIMSERLYAENERLLSLSYVFPSPGVYEVRVAGKPEGRGDFQEFALTWDLRVTEANDDSNLFIDILSGHWPHFIIAAVGAIFVVSVIARDQWRLRKARRETV
jgi:hypothetical protein